MSRGGRRGKKKPRRAGGRSKDGLEEQAVKMEAPLFGGREQPPPEFREQYLFLFEFFVNHVTGDRLAKLNQMFFVPTCISFEFLDFYEEDGIEVTPVDPLFQAQAGVADDIEYFYTGRSVVFAIDQESVVNKALDTVVKMLIRKRMPEDIKPDVFVGEAKLDLTMQFAALRKEMLHCWYQNVPPPKVFEGDVPLTYDENVVGCLSLYVRMSAFGQSIVTEFEAPESDTDSFVFKGDRAQEKCLTYKCRVVDPETADIRESREDVRNCPACAGVGEFDCPCEGAGTQRLAEDDNRTTAVRETKSRSTCADKPKGLIQTSRGPGEPCGKAVVLKVSGLLDTGEGKKPTVTVAPESEATDPSNVDPEHDVFILRIGKKGLVGMDEKSDIQLEMRTPKGPERRPPLRFETREMQTEADRAKRDKKGKKKRK